MARLSSKPCLFCYIFVMSETKKLFKMGLSDVKEFMPDKPVTFDPPKMMFVWDDEDANDPETGAPYLAEVFYVNPGLGVKRVFARGDGMAAQNMGATWDHCAETTGMGAKAVYDYLHDTKDDVKIVTDEADRLRNASSIVTYRELSEWLSRGNGQVMIGRMNDAIVPPCYSNTISYIKQYDDVRVPCSLTVASGETYFKVRKYGDKEFVDPTREYMEIPKPGYSSVAVADTAIKNLPPQVCQDCSVPPPAIPRQVAYNLGLMPGQCFHDSRIQPDWNAYTKEGRNG